MKRYTLKTLVLLVVLSILTCSLPEISLADASPMRTLSMRVLIAENPAMMTSFPLRSKGVSLVKAISAPSSTSMQRFSDFTVDVKVAPVTLEALYDLSFCYNSTSLTYQSATCAFSGSFMTVSFNFSASGAPGSTNVKFFSAARKKIKDYTRVRIRPIPVSSVTLGATSASLTIGETMQLDATVLPENASNPSLRWLTSNKRIATVSRTGLVTAKRAGSATITAVSVNGGKRASCTVDVTKAAPTATPEPTVTPAPDDTTPNETVYRALLIGNELYSSRLRGPYNDLIAMTAVLNRSSIDGKTYTGNITALKDETKSEILADIAALAKKGIDSNDVTLFYYSGHGGQISSTESGTGLVGVDSRLLSVTDLKSALDAIPGKVIVILDSCYSGMFIGKSTTSGSSVSAGFNSKVMNAFTAIQAKGLTSTQYHVITACRKNETSLSVGYSTSSGVTYVGLASYYLAIAGGYDLFNSTDNTFYGDYSPVDNIATFSEVFAFADHYVDAFRTSYNSPDVTQDMQYFSSDTSLPIFGRT